MSTLSRTDRDVVVSSLNRGYTENRVDHYHRLKIVTEQRGLHCVKSINGLKAGLGYSRDYLTTSDREALEKFLAEHGQILVDFDYESDTEQVVYSHDSSDTEIKIEQFPVFVTIQNAGGACEIVKVLVETETIDGCVKARFSQWKSKGVDGRIEPKIGKMTRAIRFIKIAGTNKVDLVSVAKQDLRESGWHWFGDGPFTKRLNQSIAEWVAYNGHHFVRLDQHLDNIELPLSTFGLNKRNLINGYCDADRPDCWNLDIALLKERRTFYTIPELCIIQAWATTSHDDCVLDFPEDHTPLQVHTAKEKKRRHDWAIYFLELVLQGTGYTINSLENEYRRKRIADFPCLPD